MAIKKVADVVEAFVNAVGDAFGNGVEAFGDAINDALNWVGSKVGLKPFFSWLGGIIKGIFSLAGAVIKGVFGIVGGIIGGLIKIFGGIFTLKGPLILEGIWDIFSPILGTIIVVLAKLIMWVQSIIYAQGFERPLTENEKIQLKKVFKGSLNYYVIRILEGHSGLFGLSPRAFTLGNTMIMKNNTLTTDLLVHETTHVWQYQQTGNRYASDAIAAQWFVTDEYNWQREINVRNKIYWAEFNCEAQAEFFQDLWKSGRLRDSSGKTVQSGNGSFYDADGVKNFGDFKIMGNDYSGIASEAVRIVRNAWF
jgi:hypothetical protein